MIRKNEKLILPLMILVAAAVVLGLAAQQKADDTALDLVCGMTVVKATARATYEYKGTTYYFCSTGCKEAFVKDPEKYLAKAKEEQPKDVLKPAPAGQQGAAPEKMPMKAGECPMMSGQSGKGMGQGMGMGMSCPLMGKDVEWSVVNTANGATLTVTSKNPETVKAIQDHFAKMKDMKTKMMSGPGKSDAESAGCSCGPNCRMKKTDKK
jgi:YHS domain-containing protein